MGSSNEKARIENQHSEEIERITAMKEDNERKRAIEEMNAKYNFQLKKEELENYAEEIKNRHEENIKKINNQHEEKTNHEANRHTEELERIGIKKTEVDNKHVEEMEIIKQNN